MSNHKKWNVFANGILNENPVLVLVLGTCPTLATSTMASNGIGMGLAATFVLVCSNIVISALRKVIPNQVRIPCYITVIAGFVSVVQMLVKAFVPALDTALGVYLPLIVVNCIILGRAESFSYKNGVAASFFDGIFQGIGYTVVLLIMCAVGLAVCFTHFDPAVYASDGGLDFDFAGSASLLSLLVFSVAGWETVSKAAADASGPAARKAGAALITCLFLVTGILCLVSTAVAGCMPWREAVGRTAPFADVLVSITGVPAVRVLFLATAFVGAVGVMNSTLYSSAQMLYGLSRFALVSRAFSALHPKYGTPARCIWFTAAFVVLTPFTGRLFFLPFINIASLATIVMWIMSLAAVLRLRRARPDLRRPVRMPGGRVTAVLGVAASVFLAGNILLPFSPGALDGLEYALAAALAALGVLLYGFRDRTLSDEAREALIFGGPERR